LKELIDFNDAVNCKIPNVLKSIISPFVESLNQSLLPGLMKITWTSPSLDTYYNNLKKELEEFSFILDRALEIIGFRIEKPLENIVNMDMSSHFNIDIIITIEKLMDHSRDACKEVEERLKSQTNSIRKAIFDLIELFHPDDGENVSNDKNQSKWTPVKVTKSYLKLFKLNEH
jgi:DNA-directed RNA polymerase subunit L